MKNLEQLNNKVRKLVEASIPNIDKDLAIKTNDDQLIFLTNIFKDGCFLGFWSHSPWGRTTDGEKGWAVINSNLDIIDSCETKTFGEHVNNDFKEWRKEQHEIHGKSFKLKPEWENRAFWRITDE